MAEITFTVEGHPEPAGSKKPYSAPRGSAIGAITKAGTYLFTHGRIYPARLGVKENNEAAGKLWRDTVQWSARAAYRGPLVTAPLELELVFYLRRPDGHWTSKRELSAEGLRRPFPTVRPDVLKLTRAIEDALTGVVYADDAQIVDEPIFKRYKGYDEPERVVVTLRDVIEDRLAEPEPQEALEV